MLCVRKGFCPWFTFERSVDPRAYLTRVLALIALKYAGDVALVWLAAGRVWRPTDHVSPLASLVSVRLQNAPPRPSSLRSPPAAGIGATGAVLGRRSVPRNHGLAVDAFLGDALIGRIHGRMLRHVRAVAEADVQDGAAATPPR